MILKSTTLMLLASFISSNCDSSEQPPRSAGQILNQFCNVCHATGWNGAPLSGDKNDWQPRLTGGFDAMFENAKQGFNNMPPMGTCLDCSDAELSAAIEKMIEAE